MNAFLTVFVFRIWIPRWVTYREIDDMVQNFQIYDFLTARAGVNYTDLRFATSNIINPEPLVPYLLLEQHL